MRDSLGPAVGSHAQAQARKLRGARDRERQHRLQSRRRRRERAAAAAAAVASSGGDGGGLKAVGEGSGGNQGVRSAGAGESTEAEGSEDEERKWEAAGGGVGWGETPFEDEESFGREEGRTGGEDGGDLVRTAGNSPDLLRKAANAEMLLPTVGCSMLSANASSSIAYGVDRGNPVDQHAERSDADSPKPRQFSTKVPHAQAPPHPL